MNILMAANDLLYSGIELVTYTLLTHNKDCNIYIFTMDINVDNGDGTGTRYVAITPDQRDRLKKLVKYLDTRSNICFIDCAQAYIDYLTPSPNEGTHFTPFASLRLLADILLPDVDDILYFDADVAITGDISGVYYDHVNRNCNYSAYVLQSACDYVGEMISGVLLLNLRKIRETHFLEHARANFKRNLYKYPDQMALRDAGNPEEFPENFGFCEKLEECTELPLVIHFTNEIAPKIYCCRGMEIIFYRKFPFLRYVRDGLKKFDTINF